MISSVSIFPFILTMIISMFCIKSFICLSTMSNILLAVSIIFRYFSLVWNWFFYLILLLFQISKTVLSNYILIFFYNTMYSRTLFSSIGYGFLPYRIHDIFMPNDSSFSLFSCHDISLYLFHTWIRQCYIHYFLSLHIVWLTSV